MPDFRGWLGAIQDFRVDLQAVGLKGCFFQCFSAGWLLTAESIHQEITVVLMNNNY
jgi:hypothetical protein